MDRECCLFMCVHLGLMCCLFMCVHLGLIVHKRLSVHWIRYLLLKWCHILLICVCTLWSNTKVDQKVRGKVLLHYSTSIDCNENSQIETTIHSKLTKIEISDI